MGDATQKLVDEAREAFVAKLNPKLPSEVLKLAGQDFEMGYRAALEAAQRPVAEPAWCTDPSCPAPAFGGAPMKHWHEPQRPPAYLVVEAIDAARDSIARGELASIVIDTDDYPQRPPVSENVRDLVDDLRESAAQSYEELSQATIDVLNRAADYISRPLVSPEAREDDVQWAIRYHKVRDALNGIYYAHWSYIKFPSREEAEREMVEGIWAESPAGVSPSLACRIRSEWVEEKDADAILARFSVPSQPVYDEEAIARWFYETTYSISADVEWEDQDDEYRVVIRDHAAALVAALRGGELTREETP